MSARVGLGSPARDTVTGFTGTVTGRAEYLGEMASLRLTARNGQEDLKERWVTETLVEAVDEAKATGFGS